MKKFWTKEIKIALTVILCLIIIFAGIQFLKGINVMKPANHYTITFANVDELMVSSPVTVNGYKVGVVHDMQYDHTNNKVLVMINIDKDMRIPRDSKITLSKGLMGGATVVIDINPYVSEYYTRGEVIEGINGADMMGELAGMMPELSTIVAKVDSILSGVNVVVSDPALLAAVQRLDGITANLQSSSKELNNVMHNDLPGIVKNVNTITNNIDTLTRTLNALPIETTIGSINELVANLKAATSQLNETDNTAGLLLNDSQLYEQLNTAVTSLDSLLNDIRTNPKRYINIKVF